jgi:hypothetical protein
MKNSIFIFLFVICSLFTLFLTGCSSSYLVTKNGDGDDKMSYKEFNREIKSKNVMLNFTKGLERDGFNIRVDTNFAKFYDFDLQETRSVKTGLLKTVVRQNHLLGGLKGFGIGILSGGALGLLVGSLSGSNKSHDGAPPGWFLGSVLGGFVGGIAGAIIGAIDGHKYEYKFVRK